MDRASNRTIYVGVDPGLGGGLAVIGLGGRVSVIAMPSTEKDVWDWFDKIQYDTKEVVPRKICAVIEKVHAMPGNGVSGMFKFGQSFGSLRMALTAAGFIWEEVPPQTWQKFLGIPRKDNKGGETSTAWKNRLKAHAQRLFPNLKITLATADALLIAEYCRRKVEGKF